MSGGEKEIQKAYESILSQHFQEAIEWFYKAIEQDPDNAEYYYKLSVTFARSSRLDEALRYARTARRMQPDNEIYQAHCNALQSKSLCARAERLMAEREEEGSLLAVSLLEQAIRRNPLEERAYLLLAAAYADTKDFQKAISALRELLKLHPQHVAANQLIDKYKQLFTAYMEE